MAGKSKPKRKAKSGRIEDHLPGPDAKRWSGRRNITLWLKQDIIDQCGPHPASALRIWIENTFPQDGL
jgi:hypothetical protein